MNPSNRYPSHPNGRGQTSFRRGGGNEYGFCYVHRKKRTRADLVPSPDVPGKWRCLPSKECRTELVTCRRHGRTRNPAQMKQVSPGVWECTANMECRGAGGASSHYSNGAPTGTGRSVSSGIARSSDTDGFSRPSHLHNRHNGGSPFAWSPSLHQGSATSSSNPQRPPVHSAPLSGYAPGGSPSSTLGESGRREEDGMMQTSGASNSGMSSARTNEDGAKEEMHTDRSTVSRGNPHGQAMSVNNDGMFHHREHLVKKRGSGYSEVPLFFLHRAGKAPVGGAGSFLAHPTVWCAQHGKRVRQAECQMDDEHFPICADPSSCLSTPLDSSKDLRLRGCEEVLCCRHRTLRSVGFVELTADHQGYQCLPTHKCFFSTSLPPLGKQRLEAPYASAIPSPQNATGVQQASLVAAPNDALLLQHSSSLSAVAMNEESERRGEQEDDSAMWFADENKNGGRGDAGGEDSQVENGLMEPSDGRLLFFGLSDDMDADTTSSTLIEDSAFFY